MKNITTKTEKTRNINGGVGVGSIINALDAINGALEMCTWAAKLGYSWGTAIGKKIFKK